MATTVSDDDVDDDEIVPEDRRFRCMETTWLFDPAVSIVVYGIPVGGPQIRRRAFAGVLSGCGA